MTPCAISAFPPARAKPYRAATRRAMVATSRCSPLIGIRRPGSGPGLGRGRGGGRPQGRVLVLPGRADAAGQEQLGPARDQRVTVEERGEVFWRVASRSTVWYIQSSIPGASRSNVRSGYQNSRNGSSTGPVVGPCSPARSAATSVRRPRYACCGARSVAVCSAVMTSRIAAAGRDGQTRLENMVDYLAVLLTDGRYLAAVYGTVYWAAVSPAVSAADTPVVIGAGLARVSTSSVMVNVPWPSTSAR